MSERWARSLLWTYRWAGSAVYPFVGAYMAWRAAKGKEDPKRRKERYGYSKITRPDGPLIWVHAASVGEMVAVMPLVERLDGLGIQVVLTTGTVTSAQIVEDQLGGQILHQYVPLDIKPAVSRFLNHWHPDLAIIAESEIWPMTIMELGIMRIPQVLINGRLSDRSFAAWKKRNYLAEALLENLALVMAQSQEDANRFEALGARPVKVTGNLKVDAALPVRDPVSLSEYSGQINGRKIWAAISTHEGEEELILQAHALLKKRHSDLLTIIVPRHPERCNKIAAKIEQQGHSLVRRSKMTPIEADTDIFLGDTIGEMGLYLRLSDIAFMGKSLVGQGGHNPMEPALLRSVVLSGPNIDNFRESYRQLVDKGGAKIVSDKAMLAGAVNYLFTHPDVWQKMMNNGEQAVHEMRGALDETLRGLAPFIQPLILTARFERQNNDQ